MGENTYEQEYKLRKKKNREFHRSIKKEATLKNQQTFHRIMGHTSDEGESVHDSE